MTLLLTTVLGTGSLFAAAVTSWNKAPDENGKIQVGGIRTNIIASNSRIQATPAKISFQINVKEKVQSGWCTAGINLFLSNKDWMQVALCDMKGKRTLEITQVRNGKTDPLAGLGKKTVIKDGFWEYNTPYIVNVEITSNVISLHMTDMENNTVLEQKIPVTELAAPAKSGRLTLRVCYAMAEFGIVTLE